MSSILKKLFGRTHENANTEAPQSLYRDTDKRISIPNLVDLPDDELLRLNQLLPWSAFIVDEKGRNFGKAYSDIKRNEVQIVPDPRIVELDKRYQLKGKRAVEAGCFEGIHSAALAQLGANVAAFDGRIENVIKTSALLGT